jgi:hypothetical protein
MKLYICVETFEADAYGYTYSQLRSQLTRLLTSFIQESV